MANEFKIKRGFISEGDGTITGSLQVTGNISGSFIGDGSQLTAITASILTGFDPNSSTFTIELIDVLDLDFYAPFNMQINTVTDLVNTPTSSLEVNDIIYVLEDPINAGDKITVTVDTPAVIQLNAERI
jgi:hypothetical protein